MALKQVNGTLSQGDMDQIVNSLQEAEAQLPFLINLTPEERKTGIKLGEGSQSFAEKTVDYVQRHPQLLPSYFTMDDFMDEYYTWVHLQELRRRFAELFEGTDDTLMAVGSSLMRKLLKVYANVQDAQEVTNISGIDTIYEDLRQRFERNASNEEEISIDEEGLESITDNEVEENASNDDIGIDDEGLA